MDKEKLDFTYAAISDAQDLIRFTETKAALGVSLIGAYIVGLLSTLENLLKYQQYFSIPLWALLAITIVLMTLCIWAAAWIIKPISNPAKNIDTRNQKQPELKFFISKNIYGDKGTFISPFFNSDKYRLSESLEVQKKNFTQASVEDIADILNMEFLKLSFIRNIKTARFNTLFTFIILTSISFLAFFIYYSSQMVWIKKLIACGCLS